jgi:predicted amidophosphoribosyltransferase
MLCLACGVPAHGLCDRCTRSLRATPPRTLSGVRAEAAYAHAGAAVRLVHNLKYRRCVASASFLARQMATRVRPDASCLVPLPRALVRRIRYGIDPAVELAKAVGDVSGLPVISALSAPLFWRQRAGRSRDIRTAISFSLRQPIPRGAVLVDDVLTSGATVTSAINAADIREISVITATSVGTMRSGADPHLDHGGAVAQVRQRM